MSYIEFNEKFISDGPNGWKKQGEPKPDTEPIVFMKYAGNKTILSKEQANEELSLFYESVPKTTGDDAYDEAMRIRDENM